jgi:hypothetical protein
MMQDNKDEIFKAFIVAIIQQTEPLPAAVQSEFNKTGATFTTKDIRKLAKLHPPLQKSYQETRTWQTTHSGIRNKGKMVRPNSALEKEKTMNAEIDNTSSSISNLQSLPEIIEQIEQKVSSNKLTELIATIFSASDSIQAAQSFVLPLL